MRNAVDGTWTGGPILHPSFIVVGRVRRSRTGTPGCPPPAGIVYWRDTPDGVAALLQVPGLVNHQQPTGAAEVFYDVAAQVIAHSIVIPDRFAQQVLQTVWPGGSDVLADGGCRVEERHALKGALDPHILEFSVRVVRCCCVRWC